MAIRAHAARAKDGPGLYGSKRDTALTATPQLSAPALRQGKLRQAAKNRSLPLTQLRGFPSSRAKRVKFPSKNRHRSAPPRRRGSAKPRSVTADIAQITDSCASPGSVSASEKGSGFVSAEASHATTPCSSFCTLSASSFLLRLLTHEFRTPNATDPGDSHKLRLWFPSFARPRLIFDVELLLSSTSALASGSKA
jgi:hypothetical protein